MSNFANVHEVLASMKTDPAILEGEVEFRVGGETRQVRPGDLVFIPKNTLHGPIMPAGGRFAALSVFAPFFDRGKKNIDWRRDAAS